MKYILLITAFICGQSRYPADTLISSEKTPMLNKVFIFPISVWQRISHNASLLNCQFYPSCSQYAAMSISNFGLGGFAMAADRIVRCNPSALHYHRKMNGEYHRDYSGLIDTPIPSPEESTKKSPVLAALFSAVIPGSGRVYAGRFFDGLFGLAIVYLTGTSAYQASWTDNTIRKIYAYSLLSIFYTGEVYGAYRTAKYYQPQ